MNKRTFLKLCSAAVSSRILSPIIAWSSGNRLTNWAGNFEYSTAKQHSANSVKDIQEFVRKQTKFKVLGTRHCFNKIADSTSEFLSLKGMDRPVALDPDARTVTIESGMTYGQLCPYLDNQDFGCRSMQHCHSRFGRKEWEFAHRGFGARDGQCSRRNSAIIPQWRRGNVSCSGCRIRRSRRHHEDHTQYSAALHNEAVCI